MYGSRVRRTHPDSQQVASPRLLRRTSASHHLQLKGSNPIKWQRFLFDSKKKLKKIATRGPWVNQAASWWGSSPNRSLPDTLVGRRCAMLFVTVTSG